MLDLVERAVEKSSDSGRGGDFDKLGSTDLESWVLAEAETAILQAATIDTLLSWLQSFKQGLRTSVLGFARSAVWEARSLPSEGCWTDPLKLRKFIDSFPVEHLGGVDQVEAMGLVAGDQATAARQRLARLKKMVSMHEATIDRLSRIHERLVRQACEKGVRRLSRNGKAFCREG
jgi:hypothetical protein